MTELTRHWDGGARRTVPGHGLTVRSQTGIRMVLREVDADEVDDFGEVADDGKRRPPHKRRPPLFVLAFVVAFRLARRPQALISFLPPAVIATLRGLAFSATGTRRVSTPAS